ncbi:uncharacterized protein LOC141614587 [Silene latifolia]|uniref:uncharacterized protein LOC141614587 n=1 Tax=Silene latifolia TaxID=37657 RepID=UPI003D76D1BD
MVVKYKLAITADSKNVSNLQLMTGQDPNFRYSFKLKCERCGLATEKESWVCLNKQVFADKINRRVHLHKKCRDCEREGTIKMVPIPPQKDPEWQRWDEAISDTEEYDCQKELYILVKSLWMVESKSGTIFDNVDLLSGDWVDWDEEMVAPVELLTSRLIGSVVVDPSLDILAYGCTLCQRRFDNKEAASNHGPAERPSLGEADISVPYRVMRKNRFHG